MIRHVVMFTLAAEDPAVRAAQAAEAAALLNGLVGIVPTLRSMNAGANALYPDVNWDLALIADFDDEAGLDAYQSHPAHKEAIAFVGAIRKERVAVDFVV